MVTVYKPDKTTQNGRCHPAVARMLLRDEKATVASLHPFSIAMKTPNKPSTDSLSIPKD